MDILYTAEALSTGAGRDGHVTTTDGRIDFDMAIPKEMGGSGNGANPEELFAAGYAACFHSAPTVRAGSSWPCSSRSSSRTCPATRLRRWPTPLTRCARTRTPRAATSTSPSPSPTTDHSPGGDPDRPPQRERSPSAGGYRLRPNQPCRPWAVASGPRAIRRRRRHHRRLSPGALGVIVPGQRGRRRGMASTAVALNT
jgi:hypothetical protein